jgi:hypothetical protein
MLISATHFLVTFFQSSIMPTLSEKLTSVLEESARFPQRPFAAQRGGQGKRNLQCFVAMLKALSGGDEMFLLRAFFSSRVGRPLLEQLGFEPKDTLQRLVEALRSLHASASSRKEKSAVLSAVSGVLSRTELWKQGFSFSPATLTRARKRTRTEASIDSEFQSVVSDTNAQSGVPNPDAQSAVPNANAQSAAPKGPPSTPSISSPKRLLLRFLEDNSREAANRTVTLKRKACNDPDGAPHGKRYVQLMVDWLLRLLTTAKIHFSFSRLIGRLSL